MSQPFPKTLGDLKRSPFGVPDRALRSVKDEMRQNLLARLCTGGPLLPGVIGYEDSVMPQIVNAILSRHNFILLGLRGQAKSRILRSLVTLLDEKMPIIAGSEVNDNPFAPISKHGRALLDEAGDDTPIDVVEGRRLHLGNVLRFPQSWRPSLALSVTVTTISSGFRSQGQGGPHRGHAA